MLSLFSKAALAAFIGLGSIAAVPSMASARDVGIHVEIDGPRPHHMPPPRIYRHGPRIACTNGEALHRARRSGLHRAYIVRRTPERIVLQGQRRGHPDRMVIADRRGCPVIRW